MRTSLPNFALLVALAAWRPVAAQEPAAPADPESAPAVEESESVVEPDPAMPLAFGERFAWVPRGPRSLGPLSAVAVGPNGRDVVVAAPDGAVWWTGGDRRWSPLLPPVRDGLGRESSDEEVRLGVEARLAEVLDGSGADDAPEYGDDEYFDLSADEQAAVDDGTADEAALEDGAAAPDSVHDEVVGDIQADADLGADPLLEAMGEEQRGVRSPPRLWFGPGGRLWVGRSDGLYARIDGEMVRVLAQPTLSFVEADGGVIVGTLDGLRYAPTDDPRMWVDTRDGTEAVAVRDLAVLADGGLVAATDHGLWRRTDDGWSVVGNLPRPALAVAPIAGEVVLVGRADALLRVDLATGDSQVAAGVGGARDIATLGGDHVLCVGAEGVLESLDGGETFSPLTRGLFLLDVRDLATWSTEVVIASEEGMFQLVDAGDLVGDLAVAGWIDVRELVDAALGRPELKQTVKGPSRRLATIIPQFQVEARYSPQARLSWGEGDGTAREPDGDLWVTAGLGWRAERADPESLDPVVIGDQVYLDDRVDSDLVGRVNGRAAGDYARRLARRVTDLYMQREAIVQRQRLVAREDLVAQVSEALRVAELEAHMDVLTGGAVHRLRTEQ